MKKNICHLIPAAGKASRLSGIPKFLLPLPEESNLLKHHLNLSNDIKEINSVKIATNTTFAPILNNQINISKNRKIQGINLMNTKTMNKTLMNLRGHDADSHLLTMPDTYISDNSLIKKMVRLFKEDSEVDVILGIWNVRNEQRHKVGQCKISGNYVTKVVDKNSKVKYQYLWGTVLFKNSLWKYIKPNDPHIGYSFPAAINNNLKIRYVKSDGNYYDCGTIDEYWQLIKDIQN